MFRSSLRTRGSSSVLGDVSYDPGVHECLAGLCIEHPALVTEVSCLKPLQMCFRPTQERSPAASSSCNVNVGQYSPNLKKGHSFTRPAWRSRALPNEASEGNGISEPRFKGRVMHKLTERNFKTLPSWDLKQQRPPAALPLPPRLPRQ